MGAGKDSLVLVTGGRGFIGRAVVKLLQREGYGVVSVDQSPAGSSAAVPGSSEVMCDIADPAQLGRVFDSQRIRGIVHLAAVLPTTAQRDPVLATRVNVGGSFNLLEMARESGVQRMVFGSSLSVYGTYPAEQVVAESDRAAPEDVYGAAKLYVEQIGKTYSHCYGLEFVSLRIGRVVGAGAQSATSAWRSLIFELLTTSEPAEIALPYSASERVLLVHVDDVARMLVTLLHASRLQHAVYNAPCESVVVSDLKAEVEALNPNISVEVGEAEVVGNPRLLDSTLFAREFGFQTAPIFEQLRKRAGLRYA
jgi:UDP-glucuronate 4-epimerase